MIDTEALRKKVIDLAIQGNLTQQLPEDGDAKNLYAQIQDEKKRLIKEGKIKKEKTLSEIKENDILFEIPSSWMYLKLGNIALPLSDGVHYAPEYQTEGYKCFSAKDIYSNSINDSECTYITEEEYLGMKDKINIRKGSILITKSGSIGRSAIVNECFEFGLVESIGVINTILVIPEYVKCVLDYGFVYSTKYFEKFTRGVGLKHLTLSLLENIPIPVPPIDEQKRIVERIEQLFTQIDIIDTLQQQYAHNLEVLKRKIIDAGISGKLTKQLPEDGDAEELYALIQDEKAKLITEGKIKKEKSLPEITDEEIPFVIPQNWKWYRLSFLCETIFDIDHKMPSSDPDGVLFLSAKDLLDDGTLNFTRDVKRISREDYMLLSKKGRPKQGDIIYSRIGSLGKARIVDTDIEFLVSYSCCTIRPILVDTRYLQLVLDGEFVLKQAKKKAQSIGVPDLGMKAIKNFMIPVPPLKEQKRIARTIEAILEQIS